VLAPLKSEQIDCPFPEDVAAIELAANCFSNKAIETLLCALKSLQHATTIHEP
jgi:hypothetical protein